MLVASLIAVFVAFCLIMAAVLMVCIHQRRLIDGLEKSTPSTSEFAEMIVAKDKQIVKILFAAIFSGALLALTTGYLVFIKTWE